MSTYLISTPYWFISECFKQSGCPKMEEHLMRYAKGMWCDCLVHDDDLQLLVDRLKHQQAEIRKENLRLKPCEIKLSGDIYGSGPERLRWIHVGSSTISLRKCRATIEKEIPVKQ